MLVSMTSLAKSDISDIDYRKIKKDLILKLGEYSFHVYTE